jgi:hypothetical protein
MVGALGEVVIPELIQLKVGDPLLFWWLQARAR